MVNAIVVHYFPGKQILERGRKSLCLADLSFTMKMSFFISFLKKVGK